MAVTRYDLSFEELAALPVLANAPGYRAKQVWEGLYSQVAELDDRIRNRRLDPFLDFRRAHGH